jgi:hypothetical protein
MMCSKNSGTAFIELQQSYWFGTFSTNIINVLSASMHCKKAHLRVLFARIHHATVKGRFRDAGLDPLIFYGLE